MEQLKANNVLALFYQCMFSDEDLKNGEPSEELQADGGGIVRHVIFDKRKIEKHKEDIKGMLSELPESFFDQKNGDSFVNMPFDKNGRQWGEQIDAERLMQLGIAAGFIWCTPRVIWEFTFGVPMMVIDLNGLNEKFKRLIEMEKKEQKATEELKKKK